MMGKKKKGGKKAGHKMVKEIGNLLLGLAAVITAIAQFIIATADK